MKARVPASSLPHRNAILRQPPEHRPLTSLASQDLVFVPPLPETLRPLVPNQRRLRLGSPEQAPEQAGIHVVSSPFFLSFFLLTSPSSNSLSLFLSLSVSFVSSLSGRNRARPLLPGRRRSRHVAAGPAKSHAAWSFSSDGDLLRLVHDASVHRSWIRSRRTFPALLAASPLSSTSRTPPRPPAGNNAAAQPWMASSEAPAAAWTPQVCLLAGTPSPSRIWTLVPHPRSPSAASPRPGLPSLSGAASTANGRPVVSPSGMN